MYFIRKLFSLLFPANRALVQENQRLRRRLLELEGDNTAARVYLQRYGVSTTNKTEHGYRLRPLTDMVREHVQSKIVTEWKRGPLYIDPRREKQYEEAEVPEFLKRHNWPNRKVLAVSTPLLDGSRIARFFDPTFGRAFRAAYRGADEQRMNIAGDAFGGDSE